MLEDEDLVEENEDSGLAPRLELMNQFRQVAGAAMQVAQSGTAKQIEEAKTLLTEVRRNMYRSSPTCRETTTNDDGGLRGARAVCVSSCCASESKERPPR
jgi:hypothetical protein